MKSDIIKKNKFYLMFEMVAFLYLDEYLRRTIAWFQ